MIPMTTSRTMDDSLGVGPALATERGRAATYRLLAALYQQPKDWPPAVFNGTKAVETDVEVDAEKLRETMPDADSLRLDHAQLFVGPFELAAPPYESVYVDDESRVMTDSTAAVQAEYYEAGVDIGIDEPADHVAAELEFVSLLVATEREALAAGDFEAVEHYLDRQYDFLVSHLGRWISELAENVREHADTEFYALLADETRSFVEADGRRLAERLERLDATDDGVITVLEGGDVDDR